MRLLILMEKERKIMEKYIMLLQDNSFVKVVLLSVVLDSILGVLRAVREHEFNSTVGINGAIRKAAMIISVAALMVFDMITHFDMLFMIPEKYVSVIGINKLGTCEFFCLLFSLYEIVSILKNMVLCGLPIPSKLKGMVEKFLNEMTEELPKGVEVTKESEVD